MSQDVWRIIAATVLVVELLWVVLWFLDRSLLIQFTS
jgi:hypothetical protein